MLSGILCITDEEPFEHGFLEIDNFILTILGQFVKYK